MSVSMNMPMSVPMTVPISVSMSMPINLWMNAPMSVSMSMPMNVPMTEPMRFSFEIFAGNLTSLPLLLCAGGMSYGISGDNMRWHVVGAHGSNSSGGVVCGVGRGVHSCTNPRHIDVVVMLCLAAVCMREYINDL